MQDDVSEASPQYWAFISYSHKDAAFGRQLHRQLERYILPRRLVGRATPRGAAPRRLAPVFRDREEFAAAHDLSAEVRAALKTSRSLVIVCSPSAAASTWVSREVEVFRELHPEGPVLTAIRAGEPPDCFPSALRRSLAGNEIEPLAADFRRNRDGARLGLLKLVAGIAGVGLDELVQRDAHRRNQRVTAVTAGALLVALVMGMSAIYALDARREAERQRGQAEGLVEFMLTDLRDKLKGVGRLDVMTAVNERALNYYGGQDLTRLPVDSLERRARILHAMGEDDEERGDLKTALAKFQEAGRTTSALLAEAPDDPERIFDQSQSEFWIGSIDYARGHYVSAARGFENYERFADMLLKVAPRDPRSFRERGYARGALCAVATKLADRKAAAIGLCVSALKDIEIAARETPDPVKANTDLVNRHSWLASAYLVNGDREHAMAELEVQDRLLDSLLRADPNSMTRKRLWVAFQRQIAWTETELDQKDKARARLGRVTAMLDGMIRFEPNDTNLKHLRSKVDDDLKEIETMPARRARQ